MDLLLPTSREVVIGMWLFALGRDGTPHDDPISLEENSKMCQCQAFTARISGQSEPRQPGSKIPAQQATISPTMHGYASCEARYQTRFRRFPGGAGCELRGGIKSRPPAK